MVQDTGFQMLLPTGKGLFAVKSVEEAAEAICIIKSDYHRHAAAARNLAEEYFDTNKVISKMLHLAGIK